MCGKKIFHLVASQPEDAMPTDNHINNLSQKNYNFAQTLIIKCYSNYTVQSCIALNNG